MGYATILRMPRRYVTVDVFTARMFGGNPLAVVLDAQGLSATQMQSVATEFNYAETTFVLPPREPGHTAQVRIFTPRTEIPFAGHPNVGTAVVLAHELERQGASPPDQLVFEEGAGLVLIRLVREGRAVVGAEFSAPQSLSAGATVSADEAAACLSLAPEEIELRVHLPQVLSVGLPFLVAEVVSRGVLHRCKPNLAAHERILPPIGTDSIFAYARGEGAGELSARMFAPIDGIPEDPATGSAAAATIALLAARGTEHDADTAWRIDQGVDMGRPSLLLGRTEKRGGGVGAVHIGGHAVPVMRGAFDL
jgi:trans-2,3-dihydro-3-hydroxyanthranilate isomerase